MAKFKSLPQLLEFFKNEKFCTKYYEKLRWNGKPVCPHCKSKSPYKTIRGYKCSNNECYKKFTVKVGTIFECSKVPFRTWFAAIYLFTSSKKGISSVQLSSQLNITQKTAWFVLHRIREMLKNQSYESKHLNNVGSFNSALKRSLYGTYHQVSNKHKGLYLNEFIERFNSNGHNSFERFENILTKSNGSLLYKNLIAK